MPIPPAMFKVTSSHTHFVGPFTHVIMTLSQESNAAHDYIYPRPLAPVPTLRDHLRGCYAQLASFSNLHVSLHEGKKRTANLLQLFQMARVIHQRPAAGSALGRSQYDAASMLRLFNDTTTTVMVEGSVGSGKSTMLKYLALTQPATTVAVFMDLPRLLKRLKQPGGELSWAKHLVAAAVDEAGGDEAIHAQLLEDASCRMWLLDGYDEACSDVDLGEFSKNFIFASPRPAHDIVVLTSRFARDDKTSAVPANARHACFLEMLPWDEATRMEYVTRLAVACGKTAEESTQMRDAVEVIAQQRDMEEWCSTPLFVEMLVAQLLEVPPADLGAAATTPMNVRTIVRRTARRSARKQKHQKKLTNCMSPSVPRSPHLPACAARVRHPPSRWRPPHFPHRAPFPGLSCRYCVLQSSSDTKKID